MPMNDEEYEGPLQTITRLRAEYHQLLADYGSCVRHHRMARERIAMLEEALRSIAANTCCDRCQEAALVARSALETPFKQPAAPSSNPPTTGLPKTAYCSGPETK